MPSAKGKPTDPKLKEKVTEEIKQQPNKDGSGKGKMAAWKAVKIGKEYEAQGGDYENEAGSKDMPTKGVPVRKEEGVRERELKEDEDGGKGGVKKGGERKKKKESKEPAKGTRSSARLAEKK